MERIAETASMNFLINSTIMLRITVGWSPDMLKKEIDLNVEMMKSKSLNEQDESVIIRWKELMHRKIDNIASQAPDHLK